MTDKRQVLEEFKFEEKDYCLMKPSNRDWRQAKSVYSRTFNDAIKANAPLRS